MRRVKRGRPTQPWPPPAPFPCPNADHNPLSTHAQGSIFFVVAAEERKRLAARREARKSMTIVQKVVDSVPGPWKGWHKENKAANFEWTEDKFRM